jgi:hypothetical protein
MGNNGEIFKLADGSVWEVKYSYEYLYEYYPSVVICPSLGKLLVRNKALNVEPVAVPSGGPTPKGGSPPSGERWVVYEQTYLQGTISGTVKNGSIFKTIGGNLYEVTEITIQVVVEVMPKVTVLRKGDTYQLVIEGFDEPLTCRKLN